MLVFVHFTSCTSPIRAHLVAGALFLGGWDVILFMSIIQLHNWTLMAMRSHLTGYSSIYVLAVGFEELLESIVENGYAFYVTKERKQCTHGGWEVRNVMSGIVNSAA